VADGIEGEGGLTISRQAVASPARSPCRNPSCPHRRP
jgi:hypothetical protein